MELNLLISHSLLVKDIMKTAILVQYSRFTNFVRFMYNYIMSVWVKKNNTSRMLHCIYYWYMSDFLAAFPNCVVSSGTIVKDSATFTAVMFDTNTHRVEMHITEQPFDVRFYIRVASGLVQMGLPPWCQNVARSKHEAGMTKQEIFTPGFCMIMISIMLSDAGGKRQVIAADNRRHWERIREEGNTDIPDDLDSWGHEALSTVKYKRLYGDPD
jgi:hypothetical protein